MQNSLFVKKNSILLSLVLFFGSMASDVKAASNRTILGTAVVLSGVAGYLRASTKEAEKAPYSVCRSSEATNVIKELLAAKQYKAAAYIAWKFFDDAIVGFVGKSSGVNVVGSSLAVKGEDEAAGSFMKDNVEYHLFEKKPVKPYGIIGCTWAKMKPLLEAMEGLTKAHKTVTDFRLMVGV